MYLYDIVATRLFMRNIISIVWLLIPTQNEIHTQRTLQWIVWCSRRDCRSSLKSYIYIKCARQCQSYYSFLHLYNISSNAHKNDVSTVKIYKYEHKIWVISAIHRRGVYVDVPRIYLYFETPLCVCVYDEPLLTF